MENMGSTSRRARKSKMLHVWLACMLVLLAVLALSTLPRSYYDNPPYSPKSINNVESSSFLEVP